MTAGRTIVKGVEVDELVGPILSAAWAHGIRTTKSAQPDDGALGFISFESADDALRFYELYRSLPAEIPMIGFSCPWQAGWLVHADELHTFISFDSRGLWEIREGLTDAGHG